MPKIFKAGNYGAKGNYTVENLKSWIGKEFSITAGQEIGKRMAIL